MHKILVIDDTLEIVDILFRFLSMKGFEVKKTYNGRDGLNAIKKDRSIDLILLDEKMTGIDGVGVLKELKKLKEKVPVIVLTSSFGISQPDRFSEVKYKYFKKLMYKPVRLTELLKEINNVLPQK
jgi:DNA-binding response OmpR family regulator